MPRTLDVALAEDAVVAEGRARFAACRRERLVELGRVVDDAHPAAAAARGRLDDERVADLGGLALGDDGHAGLARDLLRPELVAALAKRLRRGPDPRQPGGLDRLGEVGVLGEEPGAGRARRAHVLLRVEVARDRDGLVGQAGVQRAAIVGRDDRDRRDPELPAGAEDAKGDLAAIGDEELPDRHGRDCTSRGLQRQNLVLLLSLEGLPDPDVGRQLQRLLLRLLRLSRLLRLRHSDQCNARATRNRMTSRIKAPNPRRTDQRARSTRKRLLWRADRISAARAR